MLAICAEFPEIATPGQGLPQSIAGGEWAEAKEMIVVGPSRDDAALVCAPRDLLNLG
jgi:hypothetical protein